MIAAPGSVEALRLGCRCPVLDNHHGQGEGPWVISLECPIHLPEEE